MTEWQFNEEDPKIVFLIKTMNKKHLNNTLNRGTLCFNFPTVFNSSPDLAAAQQDEWDSHLSFDAMHIMYAPIISEDENGIHYGTAKKLADKARLHQISETSKATPLCSFRKVEEADIVKKYNVGFVRLGDALVDRIKKEFGHDAFILVYKPHELMERIAKVTPCFARNIHYGEIDADFQKFLDTHEFEQKEMFQKSSEYAWQKEFRVIIKPRIASGSQIIEVGSIEDIAFGGDIEELRQGFVFGETEEQIKRAIENAKLNGDVYD